MKECFKNDSNSNQYGNKKHGKNTCKEIKSSKLEYSFSKQT